MVKVMEEVLIKLSLMKLVQILLILSKEIDNVKSTDIVVINTGNRVKQKDNPITNWWDYTNWAQGDLALN